VSWRVDPTASGLSLAVNRSARSTRPFYIQPLELDRRTDGDEERRFEVRAARVRIEKNVRHQCSARSELLGREFSKAAGAITGGIGYPQIAMAVERWP
jgi:hypothetical protein